MEKMKIDESYAKSPKWEGGRFLPFTIEVPPVEISEDEVPPKSSHSLFSQLNEEKMVMCLSSAKKAEISNSNMFFIGAGLMLVGMYLLPRMMEFNFEPPSLLACLPWAAIPASLALYWRLRARKFPDSVYVTFYRQLGLIELPRDSKGGGYFTIRFDDLKAIKRSITTSAAHQGPMIMFMIDATPNPSPFKDFDWKRMSWSDNPMEYWSFYVWYMDKNRPLPPGTAFDPYRQRDYERRKAEGFPAPLYESKIPTPEYVPGSGTSIVDNLN